jgi:hypothetical protein
MYECEKMKKSKKKNKQKIPIEVDTFARSHAHAFSHEHAFAGSQIHKFAGSGVRGFTGSQVRTHAPKRGAFERSQHVADVCKHDLPAFQYSMLVFVLMLRVQCSEGGGRGVIK